MKADDSSKFPPPALFSNFVMGLATAAFIDMGIIEHPIEKTKKLRPAEARTHIDMLAMLQEKTRGNLTPEEKDLLDRLLVELKLKFASVAK